MAGGGAEPGERRGGRQKGTPNKAAAEVRELALNAAPALVREPDQREKAAIQAATARVAARPDRPSVQAQMVAEKRATLSAPHSDHDGWSLQISDAFGTASPEFTNTTLQQLLNVVNTKAGETDAGSVDAALAAVASVDPQNETEAMLAVQMAGTHSVAMEMLRKAKFATVGPALQEYGNLATKLLRTYTAQMECLAKVRRRGEQKVTVEHVHVYPGGQAIVGNVNQSGGREGVAAENHQQAYATASAAALESAPSVPVWRSDQIRETVPVAVSEGEAALPNARRGKRQRRSGGAS